MSHQSKINSHKLDIIHAEIGIVVRMMTEQSDLLIAAVSSDITALKKSGKKVNISIDEINKLREEYAKLYKAEYEGGE